MSVVEKETPQADNENMEEQINELNELLAPTVGAGTGYSVALILYAPPPIAAI